MKTLKVMKHIYSAILSFLMIVSVTGCMFEVLEEPVESPGSVELIAMMETGPDSKTSLSGLEGGMYYPLWSAEDEIAVFADNDTAPSKFTLISGEGETKASFSGTRSGDSYIALYPYDETASVTDGILSMTLPQTQKYAKDSFGQDAYPMLGRGGSDDVLDFTNLCAVLKISFEGTAAIRSVTLTANDEKTFLSGPATVALNETKAVASPLEMSDGGSNSVVLECKGLEISEDSPADVFIAIPAQTYKGGLTIEVDTYTDKVTKAITSDLTFARSQIRTIPRFTLDSEVEDPAIQLAKERDALIAIYNALDGDNWANNENWCSDKPVGEWFGVGTLMLDTNNIILPNPENYVTSIELYFNNLTGDIPPEIGDFQYLRDLRIGDTKVSSIPKEIGKLTNLRSLDIGGHGVKVTPKEIDNLVNLRFLYLWGENVVDFQPELSTLVNLEYASITRNSCVGFISGLSELKKLKGLSFLGIMTSFPDEIRNMKQLEKLTFTYSDMRGANIPAWLYELTNLTNLSLFGCGLEGNIPEELGNLANLVQLDLGLNNLTGSIPASFSNLVKLQELNVKFSNLSGVIPASIVNMPWFQYRWGEVLLGNQFDMSGIELMGPCFSFTDIYGQSYNSKEIYETNEYTIFYQWRPSEYIENTWLLKDLYNEYHDKGLEIIACTGDSIGEIMALDTPWINFIRGFETGNHIFVNDDPYYTIDSYPMQYWGIACMTIINSEGKVVYSNLTDNTPIDIFLAEKFGDTVDYYISTDYSQDGKVETLHTATEGNGIDIVLMGDAYSDRQIADGTYEADMIYMYDNLFTKEPFRTHKDMFNVYYVNVVSATEGYEHGNTAFSGYFGEGTQVGGNDNAVFRYALNALSEEEMDEALLIVAMNSDAYAGTCYMYYPTSSFDTYAGDYGSGPSIAYFPKGGDKETFAQLLHHEANGHGFAKLADEYAYESMGTVPLDEVTMTRQNQDNWGWWKNVDFTSDLSTVRWAHFIEDDRYAREGLGAYQGGMTYWSGVWRPTYDSIMRYNVGDFNPPSREAIYYRIHKLAYGDSWEYDYEKFVEYDAVNRSTTASRASRSNYVERALEPTSPPVVVGKSWRAAE